METKVDALCRLRREGRWDAASRHRADVRKNLREQGLSRRDAREGAWESMLAAYPPVEADAGDEDLEVNSAFFAAMASFPPIHPAADAEGETPLADVWWAYSFLRALQFDSLGVQLIDVMFRKAPSVDARRLSLIAWQNPAAIYAIALAKFECVVRRLELQVGTDDEYLGEMHYHLSFIEDALEEVQVGSLDASRESAR